MTQVWAVWGHDYHDDPYWISSVHRTEQNANETANRLTREEHERETARRKHDDEEAAKNGQTITRMAGDFIPGFSVEAYTLEG